MHLVEESIKWSIAWKNIFLPKIENPYFSQEGCGSKKEHR